MERIVELRMERRISQAELSRRAGLSSPGHMCRIETGQMIPTLPTLAKIADGLGVEVADLLTTKREKAVA